MTTSAIDWSITDYRGLTGLEQLEDEWRILYAAMPNRSRYHSYEANRAFVRHLSQAPGETRWFALRDGARLRAICPLEQRVDMTLAHPITTLATPWHPHWLVSDVVCPEDDARRVLIPTMLDYLRQERAGRRLLLLGPLPQDSCLWDGLKAVARAEYCASDCIPSYVFDCRLTFEEIQGRLRKHFRRNLRSHRRKLLALEDVRFASRTGPEDTAVPLDAFMAVEASGWKGASGSGSAIALHPRVSAFYRDLASFSAGREDRCEINSVYLGERCIASQICLRTGREYTILKICYDEDFARLGPGQLLLEDTIQRCCEDPDVDRLDLVSDAAWCADWQPDRMCLQQAHLAIGRLTGRPPIALLRTRYGSARRLARWVRAKRQVAGGAATGRSRSRARTRDERR